MTVIECGAVTLVIDEAHCEAGLFADTSATDRRMSRDWFAALDTLKSRHPGAQISVYYGCHRDVEVFMATWGQR